MTSRALISKIHCTLLAIRKELESSMYNNTSNRVHVKILSKLHESFLSFILWQTLRKLGMNVQWYANSIRFPVMFCVYVASKLMSAAWLIAMAFCHRRSTETQLVVDDTGLSLHNSIHPCCFLSLHVGQWACGAFTWFLLLSFLCINW